MTGNYEGIGRFIYGAYRYGGTGKEGQEGWRLVQILPPDLMMSNSVEKLVAIFERPLAI